MSSTESALHKLPARILPGYVLREPLLRTDSYIMYRARRRADGRDVIVKLATSDRPSPLWVENLRREFDLSHALALPNALQPLEWLDEKIGPGLVFTDAPGLPLSSLQLPLPRLEDFLTIARNLAQAVGDLHAQHVAHLALRPEHCLWDAAQRRIHLTGFGSARFEHLVADEAGSVRDLSALAYCAPEQNGRIGYDPDQRSDLYALGCIYYEMLTGAPPFSGANAAELIHAHLARRPVAPDRLNPDCPPALAKVLLRLLAKMPDDRYPSVPALLEDLEQSVRRSEREPPVDAGRQLRLPTRAYGRDKELAHFDAAFAALKNGAAQTLMISGSSGIGKTTLLEALRDRWRDQAGFLHGEFDRERSGIPFSGWITACSGALRELLEQPPERLDYWRQHLPRALRGQLPVLAEIIPELNEIIGRPPAAASAATNRQKRFDFAFRALLDALARPERPLVILLDDLHWADGGSLQLLEALLEDRSLRNVMIVGSYRDSALAPAHRLSRLLKDAQERDAAIRLLQLPPLPAGALARMLTDMLAQPRDAVLPLADWLHCRSKGNPLFARQILLTLHEHGLLRWDGRNGRWSWTLEAVRRLSLPENLRDLLTEKLSRLPEDTRNALITAASLGMDGGIELLAIACGVARTALQQRLSAAEEAQLISVTDGGSWRFVHDQVQQAAYHLLPDSARAGNHLRIARALAAQFDENALGQHLFQVVGQFTKAVQLLESQDERLLVARLNLKAGRRAKAAAAFETARDHFMIGAELLPERPWKQLYELTYQLIMERAECEYVLGEYELSRDLFEEVLSNARSNDDQARAYLLNIALATKSDDPAQALEMGRKCLALYGVRLASTADEVSAAIDQELEKVQCYLRGQPLEDLQISAQPAEPHLHMVARVLTRILTPAYQTSNQVLVLVTLKLLNVALRSGDERACAFAFSHYGMILGPFLGDYRSGAQFSRMALDLGDSIGDPALRAVLLHTHASGNHWMQPFQETLQQLQQAYRLATEAADPLFIGLTASFVFRTMIVSGERLDRVLDDWQRFQPTIERLRYEAVALPFRITRQWVLALKGRTRAPGSLSDEHFDEDQARGLLYARPVRSPRHWYWVLKAILHYFAGDIPAAAAAISNATRYMEWAFAQMAIPEHAFFEALIAAAGCRDMKGETRKRTLRHIESLYKRLCQWSQLQPRNYGARARLIEAELLRLRENPLTAIPVYEAAVAQARRGGGLHVLALCHELAGRCYLEAQFEAMARAHLAEARYCYLRWGATAKAERLAADLPELIPLASGLPAATGNEGMLGLLDPADVDAITKVSHELNSELELPQLISGLLKFAMRSAGADRVLLILQRDNRLFVEAEADLEPEGDDPRRPVPLESHGACALSIVNYVCRTRKTLVVANVDEERSFAADPWIAERRPRSIMCLPIIRKGSLLGLIYLENALTAIAFDRRRAALLELLCAKVATSLENALLYDDLERELQERRRAEAAARESEHRWRAYLDNARRAVVGLDLDGRIEYLNPYLLELTGFSRDELIGRNWFDTMLPSRYQHDDLQEQFYQQLRDRPHSSLQGTVVTRDGRERKLEWVVAWLRDAGGNVIGTVSVGEDITERLKAEREEKSRAGVQ